MRSALRRRLLLQFLRVRDLHSPIIDVLKKYKDKIKLTNLCKHVDASLAYRFDDIWLLFLEHFEESGEFFCLRFLQVEFNAFWQPSE